METDPEVIRQQVEETKLQLVEKLDTLEQHVADTVQSAGSAVNSTVETVQETVESVTGAVHDTVKSIGSALDVGAHVRAHPWLVVGGAAALGFFMARRLARPPKSVPVTVTEWPQENLGERAQPEVVAAAVKAAYESGLRVNSPWRQLQLMAVGAATGLVQDVTSRAANEIWRQVSDRFGLAGGDAAQPPEASQDKGQLQIHSSDGASSDNPWQRRH